MSLIGAAKVESTREVLLLHGWLELKRAEGSAVEQCVYAGMGVVALVQRLLVERPLVFFKAHDEYAPGSNR